MAAIILTQTDISADSGFNVGCSGAAAGAATFSVEIVAGGTAGVVEISPEPNAATNAVLVFQTDIAGPQPNKAIWEAGDYVVRLNITTANSKLTWNATYICERTSGGAYNTVASLTGQSTVLGAVQVETHTVNRASDYSAATDSTLYIVCVFDATGQHGGLSVGITPDQDIDTPIEEAAGGLKTIDLDTGSDGIASTLVFGTTQLDLNIDVLTNGIASTLVFGTTQLDLNIDVDSNGIASTLVFGTAQLDLNIDVLTNGIASTLVFGATQVVSLQELDLDTSNDGIASTLVFGTTVITTGAVTIDLDISNDGIASTLAFGITQLDLNINVDSNGIASTLVFGTAVITTGAVTIDLDTSNEGIASTLVFGTTQLDLNIDVDSNGIASTLAFGTTAIITGAVTIDLDTSNDGIASTLVFGTTDVSAGLTINLNTNNNGIASTLAFGTAQLDLNIDVDSNGITSTLAFGTAQLDLNIDVDSNGIASTLAFGTTAITTGAVTIDLDTSNDGIASTLAFGTTAITTGAVTIDLDTSNDGIASTLAFGTALITRGNTLEVVGIASTLVMGDAVVIPGVATISPAGITSTLTFGTLVIPIPYAGISAGGSTIGLSPAMLQQQLHKLGRRDKDPLAEIEEIIINIEGIGLTFNSEVETTIEKSSIIEIIKTPYIIEETKEYNYNSISGIFNFNTFSKYDVVEEKNISSYVDLERLTLIFVDAVSKKLFNIVDYKVTIDNNIELFSDTITKGPISRKRLYDDDEIILMALQM